MKSQKIMSFERSSNNGSVSLLKKRKKVSISGGDESFLDLSALHDSFISSVILTKKKLEKLIIL